MSFFKPLDYLLMLLGLAICTVSILAATTQKEGTPLLLVSSPTAEYVYPLDKDDTIQIKGLEGITEIHIQQGQASYLNSPCANKTCMAAPPIHRNGEWSACLPNGIFMRVNSLPIGKLRAAITSNGFYKLTRELRKHLDDSGSHCISLSIRHLQSHIESCFAFYKSSKASLALSLTTYYGICFPMSGFFAFIDLFFALTNGFSEVILTPCFFS